jgi:hypothetical protein
MGLFDSLFKKQPKIKTKEYFQLLNGYTPVYTNYNGSIYEMLQTKAIINAIATDCGKAVPQLAKSNTAAEESSASAETMSSILKNWETSVRKAQ